MAATESASTSKSVHTCTECRFLSIAGELRNEIYRLTFYGQDSASQNVDLIEALRKPQSRPSMALLLTCRTIYTEAKSLYREAFQQHWSLPSYTISVKRDVLKNGLADSTIRLAIWINAEQITRLQILNTKKERFYEFIDGLWYLKQPGKDGWWNYSTKQVFVPDRMISAMTGREFFISEWSDGFSSATLDGVSNERIADAKMAAGAEKLRKGDVWCCMRRMCDR